ncbi:hypothetical protein PVAP13_2NG625150 [Panicum virgatum]|uniref:Secreted protein n=1 Tax=Panicum virgatum TaxID=38727 RepID=A0A8T0VRZ1_PANVG|nr:hypothetical protein PVAP13_2NG625150 [Panicum virgatum]
MSLTLLAQLLPIPAHCSSTSSTAGSSKQDPASIVACTSTTSAHPLPTPAPGSILSSRSVPCKKELHLWVKSETVIEPVPTNHEPTSI